jgi:hypothetical protein
METPNLETIISKKIQKLKTYIENRCGDNSLCLDTCEYNECLDLIYSRDNNKGNKTKEECLAILEDWQSNTDILNNENYIQSISIFISGTINNIKNMGLFTHGFNLINLGIIDGESKFILCDSWEGMHLMKCRKNIVNLQEIIDVIVGLLELNVDIISKFDDLFNDELKTNWENETKLLKEMGMDTETYSSEKRLKFLKDTTVTDIVYKLDIKTYTLDRIIPYLLGGRNKNKTKKNKNKKSKKSKNKKSKSKGKSKK